MEEERKEKKTIKCSYAMLVVILFAALAFVTDYAIIERKTRKCDCPKCEITNNEVISDNKDNTQVTENKTYSYEDIAGVYEYKNNEGLDIYKIALYLYTDGTYYYNTSIKFAEGNVGNYIIKENKIILNSIATHGSDIGRHISFSSATVSFDGNGNIIDNNPSNFIGLSDYQDVDNILLERVESYNDQNNEDSKFKKILDYGIINNSYEEM